MLPHGFQKSLVHIRMLEELTMLGFCKNRTAMVERTASQMAPKPILFVLKENHKNCQTPLKKKMLTPSSSGSGMESFYVTLLLLF